MNFLVLIFHRLLWTWFKEAQAQVCTFIFLCLMLNAKLEATTDLDVYLKTLKIAQITFDYNQEHLSFAPFCKIESLIKY